MPAARKLATTLAATSAVALLAIAGSASASSERSSGISITGPTRIVQGDTVKMTVMARSGARCTLMLRYKSGSQRVGPVTSVGGKALFTFDVARRAAPGAATVKAACGAAGSTTRKLVVIGAVIAPKINVLKQGFSIRPHPFGGSTVSWGVVLQNTSTKQDAADVYVLANFVLPDNTLIGSQTRRITRIGANAAGVGGGDLHFIGVPPIARLEVVVQVKEGDKPRKMLPLMSNEHVVPDRMDPRYVGSVEGEVANDDLGRRMRRAELYAVALDAAGNVLGGGAGYASATLPPGSRQFFKIVGLRGVQMASVASLMTAAVPTYEGEQR
jgi:hypothetical protein